VKNFSRLSHQGLTPTNLLLTTPLLVTLTFDLWPLWPSNSSERGTKQ